MNKAIDFIPEDLPFWKKIIFALGQMGWALTSFGVAQLVVFFYLPPETGAKTIQAFISDKPIFGVFTLVGLITSSTYFIGCFMEPIISNWSEKATFKFGKRRTFLAIAILPFVLFSLFVFTPPIPHLHWINAMWLFFAILALYFAMTLYVTPFNALINEISHSDSERLQIVMMISIGFAVGYGIGNSMYFFLPILEQHYPSHIAFKYIITIFSCIGLVAMLLPVIFIDEQRYCYRRPPNITNLKSMIHQVFSSKKFKVYAWVELLYWIPNTMFMMGIPYFITLLYKLDKSYATGIILATGITSFATYGYLGKLVTKYGNKKVMLWGFQFFALSFLYIALARYLTLFPAWVHIALFLGINTFPLAVFGVIPMSLTGDIANEDGKQTGIYKNAAFYGMKSFMMKIGISIAQLIFPSMLILGKSIENPNGIQYIAICSFVFILLAYFQMRRYQE
jgi:GPH family glycoside/pentoside/hexuronide:cation symporter